MKRFDLLRDERGMTLVELLVAASAGVIVMLGISLSLIVTMRGSARVANHIEANQNARLTMSKVIDQLHSACIASRIAPIKSPTGGNPVSSGASLVFLHQTGAAVSPTPVKSAIVLSGTTLTQSDYAATGGSAPEWTFSTTPSSTRTLATGISAISASIPIFRYFGFGEGQVAASPFAAQPLSEANAAKTVQVDVAFKAASAKTLSSDANSATLIQDSAIFRLTPPSFETSAENLPCQ
ncbi:MAG TPA: prepilin-type N-terminal cleavage/methylation domain-containing protein [Solirubrobacterales bacterium]|jgi:Tfp pilus assembly protein PilW|nr:prepilin-type N-terminal cleavage/methylation domain-containing protein [Solirubrobacterales bacterium]